MKTLIITGLMLFMQMIYAQPAKKITGIVQAGNKNEPVRGATVALAIAGKNAVADQAGRFDIAAGVLPDTLLVSSAGYTMVRLIINQSTISPLIIRLQPLPAVLDEVVVQNGYQVIERERASGSFTLIDNKTLNTQVSSDILGRLENIAPGLLFNRTNSANTKITIRGEVSLFGSTPLIVLDNFPYEGDMDNINPNDIESIVVLKDAAAASIWGARAGNGVIVITSKKGAFNRSPSLSVTSNISSAEKPDLYYQPLMDVRDYVEWENYLFSKGRYATLEASAAKASLSPVVELLIAKRDGLTDIPTADAALNALRSSKDVRDDQLKWLYRNSVVQRTALNLTGGGANMNYYVSAGYDKDLMAIRGNSNDRFTLTMRNVYTPHRKIEVTGSVLFTQAAKRNTTDAAIMKYPYESWADESHKALPVTADYRRKFIEEAQNSGLLNWKYYPLDEIGKYNIKNSRTDNLVNLGIKYKVLRSLTADMKYQFERQSTINEDVKTTDLYAVRNLINRYTQAGTNNLLTRPLPIGGILDLANDYMTSHAGRIQLSFERLFNIHRVNVIAGTEIRQQKGRGYTSKTYGYVESGLTTIPVDYITPFKQYNNTATFVRIPYGNSVNDETYRNLSLYGNASYSFKNKYTLTASVRKDASNQIGVKSNQRWQPLWSAGAVWNIDKERYYKSDFLPMLRLRGSYGFNGNIAKGSAFLTALYGTDSRSSLVNATIQSPPNPGLLWEKVKIINIALEFALVRRVLTGTIEYYNKQGLNLIGNSPLDPTTGFFSGANYSVVRNYASTKGKGIDLNLSSLNVNGIFIWKTDILFSYNKIRVSEFFGAQVKNNYLLGTAIKGYTIGEIFSYNWQGLNASGLAQGMLNKQITTDYQQLVANTTPEELIVNGPSIPPVFGAIHNTFVWKNISLQATIAYKAGYNFRRPSFTYGVGSNHKDYAQRWQKAGDENVTQVPAIPEDLGASGNFSSFYANSSILVEKGDHIRLSNIQFSYTIPRLRKIPLKNAQVYVNLRNVALLWAANDEGIDPDFQTGYPASLTTTVGINIQF